MEMVHINPWRARHTSEYTLERIHSINFRLDTTRGAEWMTQIPLLGTVLAGEETSGRILFLIVTPDILTFGAM